MVRPIMDLGVATKSADDVKGKNAMAKPAGTTKVTIFHLLDHCQKVPFRT
jgi:hypothetical protein